MKKYFNRSKLIFGLLAFLNLIGLGILAWIELPLYFEDFSNLATMRRAMDGASFLFIVIIPLFFADLFCFGWYYVKKNKLSLNVTYHSEDSDPK